MKRWERALENATWIWPEGTARPNTYADFYLPFCADPGEADLYIAADTDYCAMCNGGSLDSAQYGSWPWKRAVQHVTLHLRDGANKLKIRVFYAGVDSSVYRAGAPGLIAVVVRERRILAATQADTLCRMCTAYWDGAPQVTRQLGFAFDYAAETTEFFSEAFPVATLHRAVCMERPPAFFPRPIPELVYGETLPARVTSQGLFTLPRETSSIADAIQHAALTYTEPERLFGISGVHAFPAGGELCVDAGEAEADGVYVLLDFGSEVTGHICFSMTVDAPCEVWMGYGEHLDDLRVRASVGGRHFAANYVACAGRQTFRHPFLRLGCRYVMLLIGRKRCTLHDAGLRSVTYPVKRRALPQPEDEMMRRILLASERSLHASMHERYEDCPWREQAYYGLDGRVEMLCGYALFREFRLARACLTLMADGIGADGLLPICAPSGLRINIPSYTLYWPVQLYEYLRASGDLRFARRMLPTLKRIMETFFARVKQGVQPNFPAPGMWNFYEWSAGLDGGDIERALPERETLHAPLTALWLLALDASAKLAADAGDAAFSARCQKALVAGRQAFHRAFFDRANGLYCNVADGEALLGYSAFTNSLAVLSGAAVGRGRDALLKKLAACKGMTRPSLIGCTFRYEALLTEPSQYRAFVYREVRSLWGDMLCTGASTFWETARGAWDFDRAGSLCHGYGALPAYLYDTYHLENRL